MTRRVVALVTVLALSVMACSADRAVTTDEPGATMDGVIFYGVEFDPVTHVPVVLESTMAAIADGAGILNDSGMVYGFPLATDCRAAEAVLSSGTMGLDQAGVKLAGTTWEKPVRTAQEAVRAWQKALLACRFDNRTEFRNSVERAASLVSEYGRRVTRITTRSSDG